MTRLRPAFIWPAYLLCLAAVAAALGWLSATMLDLEQAEFDNNRQALQAENERLALWRMESAIVPLIAQENTRPHLMYRAFYNPDDAYSAASTRVPKGAIYFPSELLTWQSPHIQLHFQVEPDGRLTSPQVPPLKFLDKAEESYTTHEKIEAARQRLKRFRPILTRKRLLQALSIPEAQPSPEVVAQNQEPNVPVQQMAGNAQAGLQAQGAASRNVNEYQKRLQTRAQVISEYSKNVKPMKAFWLDGHLILARQARIDGQPFVQGCVLDWDAIREWLLAEVKDLIPNSRLVMVDKAEVTNEQQFLLASIPVRLEAAELPPAVLPWYTPTRIALGVSWLCFLLAAVAVGLLLLGTIRLSERRGAFVSAVTHELRTPLTTFRLYTEMLNRGMVDPDGQREYLETLHQEAERLGHLVENVLSYARLENRNAQPSAEEFVLNELLERNSETLSRRCREAGMTIEVNCPDEPIRTCANSGAVERIVYNLVDNACKYARTADNRQVHVECGTEGKQAFVRVTDHGPGVSADAARRLFTPFAKSDRDAANSAPGVGLGLSLCRRLARSMRADLQLAESSAKGASFLLTLPLCETGK